MNYLPFFLNLENKQIVIIGGGKVAERRLRRLLPFKENITIVSPTLTESLQQLIHLHNIHLLQTKCELKHFKQANLIVIATNDVETNQYVVQNAPSSAWINATHQAEAGNMHFPITIQRGKLQIAISTGGASPILAKRLKESIEAELPDQYEQYIDFLFEARQLMKQLNISSSVREKLLHEVVENPIYSQKEQQIWIEKIKKTNVMEN
ncbi:precorrin-2 dehydrogenase/sirohydrochlorin ferrochelatase family protein [Gracilibacillus thailandensis]|uniref:precorrin-2 dehydrogenase n=1 Tax=Gracilibacillus thailandensis TaxID=563735 RepID=A0A6N7QUA3_9BACI|nr:NAD(P)-dependent oxidoreductase [Gracilibacillus thailandensis]MRI65598.1 NAD(P)-binding protein [Gracilibacillus thailandensis]